MTISHTQLCAAVDSALHVERALVGWRPEERYAWLTEAELSARVREALIQLGHANRPEVKINGSGRRERGATRLPDIVIGRVAPDLIEVVYAFADAAPSPGAPLCDDLTWLRQAESGHVISFFPRMRPGYKVQNHQNPYDLTHAPLTLAAGEYLLTDSLQVGGLDREALELCNGAFRLVTAPPHGRVDRWSLGDPTQYMQIARIERSQVGSPTDPLWALVWSKP
jgi:hypothetical protein